MNGIFKSREPNREIEKLGEGGHELYYEIRAQRVN